MGYVNKINIAGGTHLIEPTLYATTGGTAAAITASITDFSSVAGVVISLKITTPNAANATLSVNSGTATAIKYNGSNLNADLLQADHIYNLVYTGTYWELLGDMSLDSRIEILDLTSVGA